MFAGQTARKLRISTGVLRWAAFASFWFVPAGPAFAAPGDLKPPNLSVATGLEQFHQFATDWVKAGLARFYDDPTAISIGFLAALLALACLVLIVGRWRLLRRNAAAESEVAELDARLDEAETLLSSEPHLLVIWRGKHEEPARILGGLNDQPGVPYGAEAQFRYHDWLEPGSAQRLDDHIDRLRTHGSPFSLVVLSDRGLLIEATARAAGSLATLSLRHLAGERRDIARISQERQQMAQELEKITGLLEKTPTPAWIRDDSGKLTWVNQAYMRAVEVEHLQDVIDRQVELIDQHNSITARGGGNIHAVMAGSRRAVDVIDVEVEGGSAGLAFDITELEETKNELERHIKAHAQTLDHLTTAVAIFGSDQKLRFFNAAYVELWQLEENWLKERPLDGEILDVLREARRLPEQADYRNWKAKRLDIYAMAEPKEDWWYLPDGQTIRVVAQQHPFGGLTYLFENVTEKLSLESRYNALIGVQSETLDNLHEGVALFGSDGRLKLFNPAFGSIWQLQTHPLDEEPHIDDIIKWCRSLMEDGEVWDDIKQIVTGLPGERRELAGRMNRPDDKVIDFASAPLPDGATLLTFVDVTDSANVERALRERADALETADRLKSEFISHVSRELRTPLTNILGFTDGLATGIAGELTSKQSEYVGYILSSSNALLSIIDDILDLATIDAGVMELNLEKLNIPELIETSTALVHERIENATLTLETAVEEDVKEFVADGKRVTQILYNLLLNAVGFSSPGGVIRLVCRREGTDICFIVSDNGQGIAPDIQSSVFDRFETMPAGSSHRGAGLGLAIVKSFVELHGGDVVLDSKPGQGTKVTCRFPALAAEAQPFRRKSA